MTASLAQFPDDGWDLAEAYRRELQVHCYRMTGSFDESQDLVQETMVKAWRARESFEARASLRTWLYKIATNVRLDALDKSARRSLPALTYAPAGPGADVEPPITEPVWLDPYPDALLPNLSADPEARYDIKEAVSLAFMVAIHVLPARQRAVLILRDVLDWSAKETVVSKSTAVSAVNSMLHRARTELNGHYTSPLRPTSEEETSAITLQLLERYVTAWESADVDGLVSLLQDDARLAMPPSPTWVLGREAIRAFLALRVFLGSVPGAWSVAQTQANGQPAYAAYGLDPSSGLRQAIGILVLTIDAPAGDAVSEITAFMDPALFEAFGFPLQM
ncbi:MAG: RNA polymerase subunit sigma-70 [Chloroflexi bacterium]|nr:RNA polymerase subunit sigma-70 [Chloroflexota bacterium]